MRLAVCILPLFLCLALSAGCNGRREASIPSGLGTSNSKEGAGEYRDELFSYAIDSLNRVEEFSSGDAITQALTRLSAQRESAPDEAKDTLLVTWPEPEMLRQCVDRLNQWIRMQRPPADWKVDPLVATLPKPLDDLPLVKTLDQIDLCRFDGYALQEAVGLRDVSLWARGEALDDLERAKALFDWTIRNIQLDLETPTWIPQFPWETLLFGRGVAAERAWIFILLSRQQGIDAAVLALSPVLPEGQQLREGGDKEGKVVASSPRPWCVGVLIEGKVYLFDPVLGLPIPGPAGVTRTNTGQLSIQPATLAEVAADNSLLRRLDVDEAHSYHVQSLDPKNVVVLLEASPTCLARRMELVQSRLTGPQKMVLSVAPSVQAERWKAAQVPSVQLWLCPFDTLETRSHLKPKEVEARLAAMLPFYGDRTVPLLKGRMLHLKGKLTGADGAIPYYQAARPSNRDVIESPRHPTEKQVSLLAKQDASYWCGLIAYQRGNYPAAIDYFVKRTLEASPNGTWTSGARYNLARTYEASNDTDRAILQYQSNDASPGYHGDLLRAKWLAELTKSQP